MEHLVDRRIEPVADIGQQLQRFSRLQKSRPRSGHPVPGLTLGVDHMGCNLEEQWTNEQDYTRNVVRGAKADDAFPEFIARKGRTGG